MEFPGATGLHKDNVVYSGGMVHSLDAGVEELLHI